MMLNIVVLLDVACTVPKLWKLIWEKCGIQTRLNENLMRRSAKTRSITCLDGLVNMDSLLFHNLENSYCIHELESVDLEYMLMLDDINFHFDFIENICCAI